MANGAVGVQAARLVFGEEFRLADLQLPRGYGDEALRAQEVHQALHDLPTKLIHAAELGKKEVSVLWMDSAAAHHRSLAGWVAAIMLFPDRMSEPRGRADIHSSAYGMLWDYLEGRGLAPHLKTVHKLGWNEYHLVVDVPEPLRRALGPHNPREHGFHRPGIFSPVKKELTRLTGKVRRRVNEAAGRYSDAHTYELARAAADVAGFAELPYERLLRSLDVMHARAYDLRRAVTALGMAAYLGEAGHPIEADALRASAVLLRSCRDRLAGGDMGGTAWQDEIQEAIQHVVGILAGGEERGRSEREQHSVDQLCKACQAAAAAYCEAAAQVINGCPAPRKACECCTQTETAATLNGTKLAALDAIARGVHTPAELRCKGDLKGGAIDRNYYRKMFYAAAAAKGALLITHSSAGDPERVDGSLLYMDGQIELLVVHPDADQYAAVRLIDRLLIELQGREEKIGKAELMGLNVSSFNLVTRKLLWLPEDIPMLMVRDSAGQPLCWYLGDFPIHPDLRAAANRVASAGARALKAGFRQQAELHARKES